MSDTPTPDTLNGVERRFLSPLCGGISDVCHHSLCEGCYSWDDSAACRCACHKSDRPSAPPASARTVTRSGDDPFPVLYVQQANGEFVRAETALDLRAWRERTGTLTRYNCDCLNAGPDGQPDDGEDAIYCERWVVLYAEVAPLLTALAEEEKAHERALWERGTQQEANLRLMAENAGLRATLAEAERENARLKAQLLTTGGS